MREPEEAFGNGQAAIELRKAWLTSRATAAESEGRHAFNAAQSSISELKSPG